MSPNDPLSGWVDPNQTDATDPPTDRLLTFAAVGLTILVLLTLIGVVVAKRGGLFDDHTGTQHVSLIAANIETDHPFTPSVASSPIEIADSVAADMSSFTAQLALSEGRGARLVLGTQHGLYGAPGEVPVCDVPTVANYLDANPDRSEQWAASIGIEPNRIPHYLNTLTAVALVADTWVTSYTFEDGHAVRAQTVLQAGNAILIDQLGVPRMHCASGDPLTPPANIDLRKTTVDGDEWPGFELKNVVAVAYSAGGSAQTVVTEFVLRDLSSGDPITRTAGGTIDIGADPSGWTPNPAAMNVPAR